MLKHMFQKFGSQYREASFASIKFSFRDSDDTWVRVDTGSGGRDGNHPDISVADAGTGLVTLTFPKCRHATIVSAKIDALVSTAASQRRVEHGYISPTAAKAGSEAMYIYNNSDALADPVDGAVLTVNMYIAK